MMNNVVVGASQLERNCDLLRNEYLASMLVLAPRELTTGSKDATPPACAVLTLNFLHRPGNFVTREVAIEKYI